MARSLPVETTTTECGFNYELLTVMYWSSPNGELLVADNHNQLRKMASETVDPTDWSHPPSSWAVPPERHVHGINECNLGGTRTSNRSNEATTLPMGHSGYHHDGDGSFLNIRNYIVSL